MPTTKSCQSCHAENLVHSYDLYDRNGDARSFCADCAGDICHLAQELTPLGTYQEAVAARVSENIRFAKERIRLKNRSLAQQVYERIVYKTPFTKESNGGI